MEIAKVALVTGSGRRRIGRHVACALAEHGYALAIHYRTAAAEAAQAVADFRSAGIEAVALQADLADEGAVQSLIQAALSRFGRLDVLVNCAGVWRAGRFEEVTAQDVQEHFAANVLATFLCARAAGLTMARQPAGGCIVNLGDWAEVRPYTGYAAYFATRGATPTLTRCLAVELGIRNPRVRVNCVQVGPVLLPEDMTEEERHEVAQATLVGREGHPRHVARAILSLVENTFITGACLPVDGGRSIYAGGY
jgi:pteridine reductase